MNKLIAVLQGVDNRTPQFRTVIAAIIDGSEHLFEGVVEGKITQEKQGTNGFGYDPIFMPNGYNITFGEMSNQNKNTISHRAVAMSKFTAFLDRKSTRLNSSHVRISYAVFCLKKKK